MFGQINDIATGHYNELARRENELHDERIKICEKCPLYTMGALGPICDRNKTFDGIRGCGCRLDAKTRVKHATCVLKKW